MQSDDILVETADRVATVTLNRPAARNALNGALRTALPEIVRALDNDPAVDALILTGADPAFCAGLDLKEIAAGQHDLSESVGDEHRRQGPLPRIAKPVIGAVNGAAVTGGLELALGCDFLIASKRACFADTHARVGVQPGWGLTVLLPQAIGLRRAKQMSLTGNYIDAATALAWGLVNSVVAHEDLLPHCRRLAADIVSTDSAGARAILGTYHQGSETTGAQAWAIEARSAREWLLRGGGDAAAIADRREAVQARGRFQSEGAPAHVRH